MLKLSKPSRAKLLLLFLFISLETSAQDGWYNGEITFLDKTVLNGLIKFNTEIGAIQYKDGDKIKAFATGEIDLFYFVDTERNSLRTFFMLPIKQRDGYIVDQFLELLVEGDVTLMASEYTVNEEAVEKNKRRLLYSVPDKPGYVYRDEFYIMYKDQIAQVKKIKDFLELFEEGSPQYKELVTYIKKNNIYFDLRSSFAKLVRQTNKVLERDVN